MNCYILKATEIILWLQNVQSKGVVEDVKYKWFSGKISKQKDVNDEKEAIRRALEYAIDNHLFEEDGDEKYVDYVEEIDEEDYHDATGK